MADDNNESMHDEPNVALQNHPEPSDGVHGTPSEPTTPGGMATLVVKRSGAETDISFALNPPSIIGRFDPAVGPIDVDLATLPEGSYVSRKHAKLTCDDGVWKVHDLGSSNGTFLLREDFERVEEAELKDGDELAFGNARFILHLTVVDGAPEPDAQQAAVIQE